MRAYLLTLTLCCFLKNINCVITFEEFKNDPGVMHLVANYHNNHGISSHKDLQQQLKNIGVKLPLHTLGNYLNEIEKDGGGYRKSPFEQFTSNADAMLLVQKYHNKQISRQMLFNELKTKGFKSAITTMDRHLGEIKKDGGGSRNISFDLFKKNPVATTLVRQYFDEQNKEINSQKKLSEKLEEKGLRIGDFTLTKYLKAIAEEAQQKPGFGATAHLPTQSKSTEMLDFSNPAPFIQAHQIAQQSSNFTSGNPGSSTSALNKGKSINFSKESNPDNWPLSLIAASHYGDAMPYHQAPPMHDDTVPSQAGTDSTDWFEENLQSNDGSLQSMVNPKNPNLFKRALGFVSSLGGASPQEHQFSPSIHDTAAASSYYPSNQPDDGTLQSMITSRNQKASHYGSAMSYQQVPPVQDTFVPSEAGTDSTDWFEENLQSNDGSLQSMVNPKNTSSSKGFDTTPYFPKAPMPSTLFPAFSNQSAQLNSSTNFGPSQTETHSWDWSKGNSQNSEEDLYSVVNKRKPSSSIM